MKCQLGARRRSSEQHTHIDPIPRGTPVLGERDDEWTRSYVSCQLGTETWRTIKRGQAVGLREAWPGKCPGCVLGDDRNAREANERSHSGMRAAAPACLLVTSPLPSPPLPPVRWPHPKATGCGDAGRLSQGTQPLQNGAGSDLGPGPEACILGARPSPRSRAGATSLGISQHRAWRLASLGAQEGLGQLAQATGTTKSVISPQARIPAQRRPKQNAFLIQRNNRNTDNQLQTGGCSRLGSICDGQRRRQA